MKQIVLLIGMVLLLGSVQAQELTNRQIDLQAQIDAAEDELEGMMHRLGDLRDQWFTEMQNQLPVRTIDQTALVPNVDSPSGSESRMAIAHELALQRRPMLGVILAGANEHGIEVAAVVPNSGASEAGILPNDHIVSIEGVDLTQAAQPTETLFETITQHELGDTVQVEIERDGVRELLLVTPTSEHSFAFAARGAIDLGPIDPSEGHFELGTTHFGGSPVPPHVNVDALHELVPYMMGYFGLPEVTTMNPQLAKYFDISDGVLVIESKQLSELQPGDVVLAIEGNQIESKLDFFRLLSKQTEPFDVEVFREGVSQTVLVELPEGYRGRTDSRIMIDSGGIFRSP